MKYLSYNSKKVNERVIDDELKYRCGKFAKSFSRVRKAYANDLILYALNNRGYSMKMEIIWGSETNYHELKESMKGYFKYF